MAVFLKLDGVDGESTDDRHKGEIEVLAWSFGVTNAGAGHGGVGGVGGGGGTGRATFSDLAVTKSVDKATPVLLRLATTGQHLRTGTLTCRTTGKDPNEFLVIVLEDVAVTSFLLADTAEDRPVENVGLAFGRIHVTQHGQAPDGQVVDGATFGWDLRRNATA